MALTKLFYLLIAFIILIPVYACTETKGGSQEASFKQQPEVMEIRPEPPVKIKLKRGTSGEYSWELGGDDADKVLEADRKLKKGLGK